MQAMHIIVNKQVVEINLNMNKKIDLAIFLMLIHCFEQFRDDYNLTKVLSRYFGVIEYIDLSDFAIQNSLVSYETDNRMKNYIITPKGINFLKSLGESTFKNLLEANYQNSSKFIVIAKEIFIEKFPR
jgi:hypothetical protein